MLDMKMLSAIALPVRPSNTIANNSSFFLIIVMLIFVNIYFLITCLFKIA